MAKTRFQRGSGCFPCGVCKRQTRDTGDNGGVELCPQCYELAGIENALSDAPESYPENPSEERKAVWARYEEEINDHLFSLKTNGIDVKKVWASLLAYKPQPEPVAAAPEPSLAKSVLERGRAMKAQEYRLMINRLARESSEAAAKFDSDGRISTHDGINISRTATDVAALAAVIDFFDTAIASCK